MPRDDWRKEHLKPVIQRALAQRGLPLLESEQMQFALRQGHGKAVDLPEKADFIEENGIATAVMPDNRLIRSYLNDFGYNFRCGRDNPVQIRENMIHMPADRLLRICQRNGIDCVELAQRLGVTLPQSPSGPSVERT